MHAGFCRKLNLDPAHVRFTWEGDTLDPNSTPAAMDMEDDDVIVCNVANAIGGVRMFPCM
jgi:hypothetical protein